MSACPVPEGYRRTPFGLLTVPCRVIVGWLYDDGVETHDATLSGDVDITGFVEDMTLTLDSSGEVDLPATHRGLAEDDLRWAARELWGSR